MRIHFLLLIVAHDDHPEITKLRVMKILPVCVDSYNSSSGASIGTTNFNESECKTLKRSFCFDTTDGESRSRIFSSFILDDLMFLP